MATATEEAALSRERIVRSPIADPAPLGLAAFALTTFVLSGYKRGL